MEVYKSPLRLGKSSSDPSRRERWGSPHLRSAAHPWNTCLDYGQCFPPDKLPPLVIGHFPLCSPQPEGAVPRGLVRHGPDSMRTPLSLCHLAMW